MSFDHNTQYYTFYSFFVNAIVNYGVRITVCMYMLPPLQCNVEILGIV